LLNDSNGYRAIKKNLTIYLNATILNMSTFHIQIENAEDINHSTNNENHTVMIIVWFLAGAGTVALVSIFAILCWKNQNT